VITARLPMQASPEMLAAVGRGYCDEWRPYRTQEAAKLYELMVKAHLQSQAPPKPVMYCPHCGGTGLFKLGIVWDAQSTEPTDTDNKAQLDEWQCFCGQTFWV